jgi:6-pyruvoyltetrahydropterin/6-carboxytetrahydropterin synthase
MYRLQAEDSFDAAHFLAGYEGKCRNIHGHRWRVIVEVQTEELQESGQLRGMYVDFKQLKSDLKAVTDRFDHTLVIESGSLKETTLAALRDEDFAIVEVMFRPTAENLSKYFYEQMAAAGYNVHAVTVYETPNNCARYVRNGNL